MPVRVIGSNDNFRSDEERRAAWLHELRNSPLAKYLKSGAQQNRSEVEFRPFVLPELPRLEQGTDALGCVIASYRMALRAQGKSDIGQAEGRRLLTQAGFIGREGGMSILSPESAQALGIENAHHLIEFGDEPEHMTTGEKTQVEGKFWPSRLAMALRKGYVIIASIPMKGLYGGSSEINHAVVISGVRSDQGRLKFFINDPLGIVTEISDEALVNGVSNNPTFMVLPHEKMMTDNVKVKTILRPSSGEGSRIRAHGSSHSAEQPPRISIQKSRKIRINRLDEPDK